MFLYFLIILISHCFGVVIVIKADMSLNIEATFFANIQMMLIMREKKYYPFDNFSFYPKYLNIK